MSTRSRRLPLLLLPLLLALWPAAASARAVDEVSSCAGARLETAARQCQQILSGLGAEAPRGEAARRSPKPGPAKGRSAKERSSCNDVSPTAQAAADLIASHTDDLLAELGARCDGHLLRAAADACRTYLDAEARAYQRSNRHQAARQRERARARAARHLTRRFERARCEPPIGAQEALERIDALTRDLVAATGWTTIVPEPVEYNGRFLQPVCSGRTPYVFHARRGSSDRLLVYYEGGGACWDNFTCGGEPALGIGPVFKQTAEPDQGPDGLGSGFADLSHPDNPFHDWSVVYVPYCTGDVHWGDAFVVHRSGNRVPVPIEHKGFVNAQVVEKWMRDHLPSPEQVFVTGSSAGAYGAIVNSLSLMENVYPDADFAVLGDAGNGVITRDFLENDITKWGIERNLPTWIPALDVPITELDAADLYVAAAQFYPRHRFATYTTAFDGGTGGQTGFYNIMRNIDAIPFWFNWWLASCDWNREMRALNQDAASRAANFRFYVGTGSAHTMWGRPKVYTDTTGGVPALVDWIRAMLDGSRDWVNVECEDCGVLLPGDPRPVPAAPPFTPEDRIVCP